MSWKVFMWQGAENIWIENLVFGINVVQSVLGGTHKTRSLKDMLLLCEAMQRLQWCEFLYMIVRNISNNSVF